MIVVGGGRLDKEDDKHDNHENWYYINDDEGKKPEKKT